MSKPVDVWGKCGVVPGGGLTYKVHTSAQSTDDAQYELQALGLVNFAAAKVPLRRYKYRPAAPSATDMDAGGPYGSQPSTGTSPDRLPHRFPEFSAVVTLGELLALRGDMAGGLLLEPENCVADRPLRATVLLTFPPERCGRYVQERGRGPLPHERGHWRVPLCGWPQRAKLALWDKLRRLVCRRRCGWVTVLLEPEPERDTLLVFCWGSVAPHVWTLLYVLSGRRTTCIDWYGADGECVLEHTEGMEAEARETGEPREDREAKRTRREQGVRSNSEMREKTAAEDEAEYSQ